MNGGWARWRGVFWWLVPVAALTALLGWETDWGRHLHRLPETEAIPAPKAFTPALLPEYRVEGELAGHSETISRTLFNPTRRPAPVLAADSSKPAMKKGQFLLTGTSVSGDRAIAFLKETAGGKSRTVRQGEQINGMMVAEVRPDRVKLTLGDDAEELWLKVAPGPKTTTVPPPPPPGAPAAVGAPPMAGVAPAAPQPGAQPQQSPEAAQQTLEERRRAARAAEAARNAVPAAAPQAAPVAPPASGQPATTDAAWNEVYRRMQQRPK